MENTFQMITDFRRDGVLHVEVVCYDFDMQQAVLEVLRDFEEEVEERWRYAAPSWKFMSRRQKPRHALVNEVGDMIVAHNDDVMVLFDKKAPTLLDIYVRSPAGLRTVHSTLLELVQRDYIA